MNLADLPDDSETSDEDYVPEGINAELPSEEDSDAAVEEAPLDDLPNRGTKRQKHTTKTRRKKHKQPPPDSPIEEAPKEDKQETAALWADFMKDTGFKTRAERSHASSSAVAVTAKPKKTKSDKTAPQPQNKVKVTEVYKFAGEEVTIEKEVCKDEAAVGPGSSKKAPSGGRLNSILNHLGKARKITTLEKSKLDWDKFKKDEKIEDELQAYGKSKDGYLERQDFLQRADVRRFEIEKEIRTTLRSNRLNNVNL